MKKLFLILGVISMAIGSSVSGQGGTGIPASPNYPEPNSLQLPMASPIINAQRWHEEGYRG